MSDAARVEVLPSAALQRAEAERAALVASFDKQRAARALAVPSTEAGICAALRAAGQPICLFGEDLHDRRERLRGVMAGGGDVEMADEGAEVAEAPAAEEDEEYFFEGSPELRALRLALARPSLERARARLGAERELRATKGGKEDVREQFQAAEARTVEAVRSASVLALQVGDTRPLSAISIAPGEGAKGEGEWIVATGSWGGTVKIWNGDGDAESLQVLDAHTARVSSARLYPGVLVTAGADAKAAVFARGEKGGFERRATLQGHRLRVSDARLHPFRASLVATASYDGSFILHDDGRALLDQETGHEEVCQACFHPDGSLLATCGTEGGIRLWDLRSGRAVMTMAKAHIGAATCLDFTGDGRTLASGGGDNMIKIWDLRGKRCAYSIPAHKGLVSGLRFAGGSGGDVLVSSSFDRSIKTWSSRRDWALVKDHAGHEDKVMAVDCSPDAKLTVSACYDKTWKLWGNEDWA